MKMNLLGLGLLTLGACVGSSSTTDDLEQSNASEQANTTTTSTGFSVTVTSPGTMVKPVPPANSSPAGTASIVFYYFNDSYLVNLAQDSNVDLGSAFEGYDYKILLAHETTIGPFDFNEEAQNEADEWKSPTLNHLVNAIKKMTEMGYVTDVYIFAHGSSDDFTGSLGADGTTDRISSSDLLNNLTGSASKYRNQSIRAVYQMNCVASTLNETWADIGAKVVSGARNVNFYPNQWNGFIDGWNDGETFETSLDDSNTSTSRTVVQTYILADALATRSDWGGCPFGQTVLGSDECAEDYFTSEWGVWLDRPTGQQNMNYSSEKLIEGDESLTKNDLPTW